MIKLQKKWWLSACLGVGITTIAIAGATVLKAPRGSGYPLYSIEETSIKLTFHRLEGQGNEPVTNRYVRVRRPWNLFWKFRGMTSTSEYQVTDLRKEDIYEYQVFNSNSAGISRWPSSSTCRLKLK